MTAEIEPKKINTRSDPQIRTRTVSPIQSPKNVIQSKQIKFMGPLYRMPGRENSTLMPIPEDRAGTGEGQQAVYNGIRG